MASILWATNDSSALFTLRELEDDALLRRAGDELWRMHDLVQDVALEIIKDAAPSGLGKTIQKGHRSLLNRYG
jgi:hypothetical protein